MSDALPPAPIIAPHPAIAAAAAPPAATTMTTPSDGLTIERVTIPVPGGQLPLYAARPTGVEHPPVILVVHEIFGVHAHIADVVRRFAKAGYLAVAPELFFRRGDPGTAPTVETLRTQFVTPTPDAQVLADLDAARAWALTLGGDGSRVSITGFCWGGRITWLYAAHRPDLKAGVAWYGRLGGPSTPEQPRHPAALADQLRAPVLGLYGGADTGIPTDQVTAFNALLAPAGHSRIKIFPNAPHAFFADYRPSYRPEAAGEAWTDALAWLTAHGAQEVAAPR